MREGRRVRVGEEAAGRMTLTLTPPPFPPVQSEEMFAKELELKKAGEGEAKECDKLLEAEAAKAAQVQAEAAKVGKAQGTPLSMRIAL